MLYQLQHSKADLLSTALQLLCTLCLLLSVVLSLFNGTYSPLTSNGTGLWLVDMVVLGGGGGGGVG